MITNSVYITIQREQIKKVMQYRNSGLAIENISYSFSRFSRVFNLAAFFFFGGGGGGGGGRGNLVTSYPIDMAYHIDRSKARKSYLIKY